MKRTLRLGLPVAVVAALIVAGVLLATRPWSGEEAVAHPAEYGLCNVSVRNLSEGVRAGAYPLEVQGPIGDGIHLMVSMAKPEMAQLMPEGSSRVVWDAVSGVKVFEYYRTPADEAKLKGVVVSVGPWKPIGPAWPRTDTIPQKRWAEIYSRDGRRTDYSETVLRYRPPDLGSGLLSGQRRGDSFVHLRVYTCESEMVIDATTGSVTRRQVVPEEEVMFQRFLDRVVTP